MSAAEPQNIWRRPASEASSWSANLPLFTRLLKTTKSQSDFSMHTGKMPVPAPLRLYPTEIAAKKAGLKLAEFSGERLATTLYALLPAGEKKPTYLLSITYRLTVAEQRWADEHEATVTKLGRFHAGGSFMPLQTNMLRKKKAE